MRYLVHWSSAITTSDSQSQFEAPALQAEPAPLVHRDSESAREPDDPTRVALILTGDERGRGRRRAPLARKRLAHHVVAMRVERRADALVAFDEQLDPVRHLRVPPACARPAPRGRARARALRDAARLSSVVSRPTR